MLYNKNPGRVTQVSIYRPMRSRTTYGRNKDVYGFGYLVTFSKYKTNFTNQSKMQRVKEILGEMEPSWSNLEKDVADC